MNFFELLIAVGGGGFWGFLGIEAFENGSSTVCFTKAMFGATISCLEEFSKTLFGDGAGLAFEFLEEGRNGRLIFHSGNRHYYIKKLTR